MKKLWLGVLFFASAVRADNPLVDAGDPFGKLPLVDEVTCGDPQDQHPFRESEPRASRIEKILGQRARVVSLARKPGYFAFKLGAGRGLVARHAYLLQVEYPEDEPRTIFVVNRGAETAHGFHTGATLGDALWTGDNGTAESLSRIPLAKAWRTSRTLFVLQDHTADLVLDSRAPRRPLVPADGFWVAVLHPARPDDPLSHGAAAARIRLFEVPDVAALYQDIRYPPEGLPRRHVVLHGEPGEPAVDGLPDPGMDNMEAWFEFQAQQLRFLGVNTWCMTLLESGRNTGWEAENDEWFAPAADPLRWEKQLQMVERYGLEVLPYFEYGGSLALNAAVPVRTLRRAAGKPYTNAAGGEPFHLDVTDPRSLEDARALLDHTIVRYKDQVRFVGAWFRTRVAQMPVSFADPALARFATEANGGTRVTRQQVAADPALRARYGEWWLDKRRAFFAGIRDYLREKVGSGQRVLFTPWAAAAGPSLPGRAGLVVTDDPEPWADGALDNGRGSTGRTARLATVVQEGRHGQAVSAWRPGVGDFEWTYALPRADVERWGGLPGLSLTCPFNHLYSVDNPAAFAPFQGPEGVAAVRFQPRNERIDGGVLGNFVADTERAGPFCLLEEAHAVAHGDPVLLGSLAAGAGVRAFPEYVRRFHAAYLALPALSSSPLAEACDDREVVVRVIRTEGRGTWLAVVNTGLVAKPGAVIRLPAGWPVLDAATGADLAALTGSTGEGEHKIVTLRLPLDPCELRAVLVQPKKD